MPVPLPELPSTSVVPRPYARTIALGLGFSITLVLLLLVGSQLPVVSAG